MNENSVSVNTIWNSDLATDCTEIEGSGFDYQKGQKICLVFKASRPPLSSTHYSTSTAGGGGRPGLGRPAREAETQQLPLAV